jgi:CubicO group peptidase (beta-lactamase class C family)
MPRSLAVAIVAVLVSCRTAGPGATADLDAVAAERLAAHHVPGAAVAIVVDRRVIVRSYGVADVDSGAKVNENTVFEAASIGKAVFAYAVLRLADEGLIDLDKPLQSYLSAPYIADPRGARITARMVLAHRTGLPNWRGNDQTLRLIRDPDSRFGYSGEGFLFLQTVIEAITHQPIDAVMRREVFEPLGMSQSSYVWLPSYDDAKAWGHTAEGKRWRRRKPQAANVAATLHTTAADLGAFAAALIGGRGLSPSAAAEYFRTQSAVPANFAGSSEQAPEESADVSWGLGIGLLRVAGRQFFWHWGDNGDFKAYLFGSRQRKLAIVVLTNGANGLAIAGELARVALRDPMFATPAVRPLQWLGYR